MNHPNRDEWVPYVFGEAGSETRARLEQHLGTCADCRAEVSAWRRSLRRLDAWRLPRPRRQVAVLQPLLKWAIAAALMLGVGFGLGRFTNPQGTSADGWPTHLDAAVRAALTARQGKEPPPTWAAEFQGALDHTQAQTSNALADLEIRLASSVEANAQQLNQAWSELFERARAEDRRALLALFRDLEERHTATYVALRKDLETVASLTESEMQQARSKLVELSASAQPPTGE